MIDMPKRPRFIGGPSEPDEPVEEEPEAPVVPPVVPSPPPIVVPRPSPAPVTPLPSPPLVPVVAPVVAPRVVARGEDTFQDRTILQPTGPVSAPVIGYDPAFITGGRAIESLKDARSASRGVVHQIGLTDSRLGEVNAFVASIDSRVSDANSSLDEVRANRERYDPDSLEQWISETNDYVDSLNDARDEAETVIQSLEGRRGQLEAGGVVVSEWISDYERALERARLKEEKDAIVAEGQALDLEEKQRIDESLTPEVWRVDYYDKKEGPTWKVFSSEEDAQDFISEQEKIMAKLQRTERDYFAPKVLAQRSQLYAIEQLQSQGVLQPKIDERGVETFEFNVPISLLTDDQLYLARMAGAEIPDNIQRTLSEKLYRLHATRQEQLESDATSWLSFDPRYSRQQAIQLAKEAKITTAAVGKAEQVLFGPLKWIAKQLPGEQAFEYMTPVTKDIIEASENLTPEEHRILTFQVALAGFTSSLVRDIPVGMVLKGALPIAGGIIQKTGRFASTLSNPVTSYVLDKSPSNFKAVLNTIPKLSKYGMRVITKHPRSLEIVAWGVSLGSEAKNVLRRLERGDSMARVAEDTFINIASMAGTDVGIRTGYQMGVPIKRGTVRIPLQGGGSASWTGFYVEYGDDLRRLTGSINLYDDVGRLISKTDDLGIAAQSGIKSRYLPQTKIQSTVTINALKNLGYTDDQIRLINDIRSTIFSTEDVASAYIKEQLPSRTGTLGEKGTALLKKFFFENSDLIDEVYGSFPTRAQLNEAYEFALAGKSGLRIPGDIDVMLKGSPDDIADFTRRLVSDLKKSGSRVRINADNPTLIEAYVGNGVWAHAVDIHGVDDIVEGTLPSTTWGFNLDKGRIMIEGLPVQTLGEQGIRKGVSIIGFTDELGIGPKAHRLKDIPDFVQVQQTLIDSGKWWSPVVQQRLDRIRDYYGVINIADVMDVFDEVVKVPLDFGVAGGSSGLNVYTYLDSMGLGGYVSVLGLPTISEASTSTGLSKSYISTLLESGYSMGDVYQISGASYNYSPVSNMDVSYYGAPLIGSPSSTSSLSELRVILSSGGMSDSDIDSFLASYSGLGEVGELPPISLSGLDVSEPLDPSLSELSPPSDPISPTVIEIPELSESPLLPKQPEALEPSPRSLAEGRLEQIPGHGIPVRKLSSKELRERRRANRILPSSRRESYRVTFLYGEGGSEVEDVSARSFPDAYSIARRSRESRLVPVEVEVEKL